MGNATLIESGDFGVLIDAGLGPRQLASRLAAVGRSWAAVNAVILTHTHADHWKDRTLAHLRRAIFLSGAIPSTNPPCGPGRLVTPA